MASNLSNGYYVLTVWASAGDVSGATVRSNYKAQYGEESIANVGAAAQGINFGALESVFREKIDQGADKLLPSSPVLLSAILTAGGKTPGVLSAVATGSKNAISSAVSSAESVAGGALSGLKYAAIIAVVGAGFYLLWKSGNLGRSRA